jgi:hypothetical protein
MALVEDLERHCHPLARVQQEREEGQTMYGLSYQMPAADLFRLSHARRRPHLNGLISHLLP